MTDGAEPELLRVDVRLHETTKLEVIWNQGEIAHPAYYTDREMVLARSREVRDCLQRLVRKVKNEGVQGSGALLKELAGAGYRLYDALFYREEGSETDPKEIRDWLKELGQNFRIAFRVDHRVHIPWGLVYDVDPTGPTGHPGGDQIHHYEDFWCFKYLVSTLHSRIYLFGGAYPESADSFKVLMALNRDTFNSASEAPGLTRPERDILDWIIKKYGDPAYSGRQLIERWNALEKGVGEKVRLLYIYCHADETSLAFDDVDRLRMYDFKQYLKRDVRGRSDPACLVFLNGCSTAVGDPRGGFLEATGKEGFCGFIGTEVKIPSVFALRFGVAFLYHFFFEGLPILRVMDCLRREHWPVGLAYGTYCYGALRVIPSAEWPRLVKPEGNFCGNPLGAAELQPRT